MGRKKPAPRKVYTPGSKASLPQKSPGKSPKAKAGRPKKITVRCAKRGKYKSRYDEGKLSEALEEVKAGRMSERQAAKEYSVPRSTLKDRLAERVQNEKAGRPTVLSTEEELILVERLILLGEWGFPLTTRCLRHTIQAYLDHQGRTTR